MKDWILKYTDIKENEYDELINPDTVNMCTKEEKNIHKKKKRGRHDLIRVNDFTYKRPTKLRCNLYGIKKIGKYYIYKDIKFRVLEENLNSENHEWNKKLYSTSRHGTCCEKSINLILGNEKLSIATAMCKDFFFEPREPFLHTFCIVKENGKEYVIDATLNIIIEKDLYLKLYEAKLISVISREELFEFFEIAKNLDIRLTMDEYFCFKDEVIEGIKKYIKTK